LKPIVRTDFLRRSALSYRENARLSEDFLYLVEFYAVGGNGVLVNQPLYHWTQSFGAISRQWTTTGAGAWRYDFKSALEANANVLRELHGQRNRDLATLLAARARAFRRLHHLSRLNRMRASGSSLPKILSTAARHPAIWPLLARRVFGTA
jgi:succinoglycan biosynthesis protein ExoO